jgi:thiosulfate dehydrogenase [quinone] large subunit
VFCFAWLPLALAGAAGQPAVDTLVLDRRTPAERPGRSPRSGARVYAAAPDPHTRRALIRRGLVLVGAGTLSIGALATAMRGGARPSSALSALGSGSSRRRTQSTVRHHHHHTPPASTTTTQTTTAKTRPQLPAGAVRLGPSSGLQTDAAAIYHDPADGSPDIVVRRGNGSLAAFSAVCTHAGCQVGFQSGVIFCPCHGSEFDPATGAVLRGPAVTPLARKRVLERRGSIYAV